MAGCPRDACYAKLGSLLQRRCFCARDFSVTSAVTAAALTAALTAAALTAAALTAAALTAAALPPPPSPPPGALILAQCIFGGGSVVGKLGVEKFNPLVFALIREVAAGALLLLWALRRDGCVPLRRGRDMWLVCHRGLEPQTSRTQTGLLLTCEPCPGQFLGCGVFIFTNQVRVRV